MCTSNNITDWICTNLTTVFRDCTGTYGFLHSSLSHPFLISIWSAAASRCKVIMLQWSSWIWSVIAVCIYQHCQLHNCSNYWHCLWEEMCFYFQMWAILWSYFSISKISCSKKSQENMWTPDKEIESMESCKHLKLSQINPDRVSESVPKTA